MVHLLTSLAQAEPEAYPGIVLEWLTEDEQVRSAQLMALAVWIMLANEGVVLGLP